MNLGLLSVLKLLRYVDDFLVFMDGVGIAGGKSAAEVLEVFQRCFHPLKLTREVPQENTLRFLDRRLHFSEDHVCWQYEPLSNKPLFPFSSGHSKLVKRGIGKMRLLNALKRSCPHRM